MINLIALIRSFKKIILFLCFTLIPIQLIHTDNTIWAPNPSDPLNAEMLALESSMGRGMGTTSYGLQPTIQYQQNPYGNPALGGYPMGTTSQAQYNPQMEPIYAPNMSTQGAQAGAGSYFPAQAGAGYEQSLAGMPVEQAAQTFDDITNGTSPLDTPENFDATVQLMEKVFNQCNFAQTAAAGGISTSVLTTKAIAALRKIMTRIDTTWTAMQRKLSTNVLETTQDQKDQDKWIAVAYMLAAAANNKSFRLGIASHTLTTSSNFFWKTHWRVFSVQPVSRRIQTPGGIFQENPIEKAFIEQLHNAENLLSSAHALNVTMKEEAAFIQGVRLLTSIINQPNFINGSIGLHEFAFWIFQNGVIAWLKKLSALTTRHEELWLVAATLFSIMYSAVIGPNIVAPLNISAQGVNRANPLPSDHIMCDFGKGAFCKNLLQTNQPEFTTSIQKIANMFITHKVNEGQVGILAKNISEMKLLMMYSEAAEYLTQEATAAEAANIIIYHFENGFKFNNSTINWAEVSTSMGSIAGIILDRLYEKTGTSMLGVESLAFSGGYKGRNGLYAATGIYQSLAQAFATLIDISTKNLLIGQRISSVMREMKSNFTKLKKYMMDRTDLKSWRTRQPRYAISGNSYPPTQANYTRSPQSRPIQYSAPPATSYQAPNRGYPQAAARYSNPAQYGSVRAPIRAY